MSKLTPDDLTTLETLIDAAGLANVVDALADIASEKAEHIRSNWQDETTARSWDRDHIKLYRIVARLEN